MMDTILPNQMIDRDLDDVEQLMNNREDRGRDRTIGRCGPISIGSNNSEGERLKSQDRLSNTQFNAL
jgi:hypothetical protein